MHTISRHNNMQHGKKQYSEVSIAQLLDWSGKNPNRGHCLTPIEVLNKPAHEEMVEIENMSTFGMPNHTCVSLDPPGPLSLFQWIREPSFQTTPTNARKNIIRCFATTLQEQISLLKSGNGQVGRKRTVLCDFIGRCADDRTTKDSGEWCNFMELLTSFQEIQLVLIKTDDERPGDVFFMSDPIHWSDQKNIWIADYDARWIASNIAVQSSEQVSKKWSFSAWLSDRESTGWIIHWIEVPGKKTELIEQLQHSAAWQPSDSKLLKDVLSQRLGKHLTIKNLLAME